MKIHTAYTTATFSKRLRNFLKQLAIVVLATEKGGNSEHFLALESLHTCSAPVTIQNKLRCEGTCHFLKQCGLFKCSFKTMRPYVKVEEAIQSLDTHTLLLV